jgi:hypothetical protein
LAFSFILFSSNAEIVDTYSNLKLMLCVYLSSFLCPDSFSSLTSFHMIIKITQTNYANTLKAA